MKNTIFASVAAFLFTAGTVTAAELGGSVGVEITENTAGDYVAEATLGFGATVDTDAGIAFGGFTFESVDGGNLTVDEWQLGVALPSVTLTFGKQGDIFVGNDFEIVGGDTIAAPADDHESLIAEFGAGAVLIGFTDITTDISEIENIQGSYTLASGQIALTAVGDYNVDSEDFTVGAKVNAKAGQVVLGGIVTYAQATEVVAYEASIGYSFVTAFVNGDDTDAFQNIGAGVAYDFNGLNVYAEGTYNVDAETNSVGAGVSFSF
jgi:hypothetical protein